MHNAFFDNFKFVFFWILITIDCGCVTPGVSWAKRRIPRGRQNGRLGQGFAYLSRFQQGVLVRDLKTQEMFEWRGNYCDFDFRFTCNFFSRIIIHLCKRLFIKQGFNSKMRTRFWICVMWKIRNTLVASSATASCLKSTLAFNSIPRQLPIDSFEIWMHLFFTPTQRFALVREIVRLIL